MGIYLFERRALEDALRAHPDAMDFGHDLLPRLIAGGWRVAARPFTGPWRDIADVDAYFEAHLPYRGHGSNYIWPHASIAPDAQVEESIVLNGAEIGEGACLRRVVVEEGVRVPAGARVVAERVTVLTAAVADDLTAPRRQRPSGATRRT
jgi:glucose-1-phosphate adenylyltransferase